MSTSQTQERPAPLEPLEETWQRALCVVAHPDDLEYGAAAAVARWTGQGKQIVYCMVTSGEAGIDALDPAECGPLREDEERASAAVVGVGTVEFLGLPDGVLEYGVALRRAICASIRRHRPEIVITGNFRDTWDGASALNQADHIAVGHATVDAARDAANRWIFPEQLTGPDALNRWDGVRAVWAAGSPQATHAVDVTDSLDAGVASLEEHRAYIDGLGQPDFDPREFLEAGARQAGTRLGVPLAAAFEVFPLG